MVQIAGVLRQGRKIRGEMEQLTAEGRSHRSAVAGLILEGQPAGAAERADVRWPRKRIGTSATAIRSRAAKAASSTTTAGGPGAIGTAIDGGAALTWRCLGFQNDVKEGSSQRPIQSIDTCARTFHSTQVSAEVVAQHPIERLTF